MEKTIVILGPQDSDKTALSDVIAEDHYKALFINSNDIPELQYIIRSDPEIITIDEVNKITDDLKNLILADKIKLPNGNQIERPLLIIISNNLFPKDFEDFPNIKIFMLGNYSTKSYQES